MRGMVVGSLALVLVGGICVPGLAQSTSSAGLSSLPPDAQGAISAALGRDDSGNWAYRSAAGFHGENSRQALVEEFTRQAAEVRSHTFAGAWRPAAMDTAMLCIG